jgi:hypothetical protein
MRGSEGVEVDRGDRIEELALVEDADNVPTDESTETVPGDGKLCYGYSSFLEFFHFLDNLVEVVGLSVRFTLVWSARPKARRTNLLSDPFTTMINAVIRVVVHVRGC